jgi:quinol monooxygenase YgiN
MTVSMIAKHKVNDFATWKKGYDGTAQLRKDGGVIADSVHRALDDPNMVTVYHQFADENTAKAFGARLDSDEFRAMGKEMGINLETVEVWLLEDVE